MNKDSLNQPSPTPATGADPNAPSTPVAPAAAPPATPPNAATPSGTINPVAPTPAPEVPVGVPTQVVQQPATQPAPQSVPVATVPADQPKKSKKGLIIGLIIGAVVLIGGGVTACVLLLNDKGPKEDDYRKAYTTVVDFSKKQANLEKLSLDAISEVEYTEDPTSVDEYSEQFSLYVSNFRTMMNNIEATGVLEDEVLKEKYDRLKTISDKVLPAFESFMPELSNFMQFYKAFSSNLAPMLIDEETLMSGALTEKLLDETFSPIIGSSSPAIKQFAEDMHAFLKEMARLIDGYNNGTIAQDQLQTEIITLNSDIMTYTAKLASMFTVETLMGITEAELEEFDAATLDFTTELYSRFSADDTIELPKNIEILGEKS
ncbi:MAG: hypothetical protein LBQ02_00685 [Candidatus Nomurabacteria bacterium]|jgi:hypothetical protein|nr:hypothetical protein [Candidatus Nomurabacteria bacterium]